MNSQNDEFGQLWENVRTLKSKLDADSRMSMMIIMAEKTGLSRNHCYTVLREGYENVEYLEAATAALNEVMETAQDAKSHESERITQVARKLHHLAQVA